jgi:hypothetical protein
MKSNGTIRHLALAVLSISALFVLNSCATFSFYHPEKAFHPLVEKDDDVQVEGGLYYTERFSGFQFQGAYAHSDNGFFSLSADAGSGTEQYPNAQINTSDTGVVMGNTDLNIKQNSGHFRLGYGYYKPMSKHILFGAQGAVGTGNIRYRAYDARMGNTLTGVRKVGMINLTLGPFFTFQSEYFDGSFVANYALSNYTNVVNDAKISRGTGYENDMKNIAKGNTYHFFQPALQLNFGLPQIKIYLNYTGSFSLNSVPFNSDTYNVSIGLTSRFSIASFQNKNE